jgi:hypothetical protein
VLNQAKVYINGNQAAMTAAGAVTLALGSINDTNNWLGRSLYTAPISSTYFDPYFNGSFDEFRIYSGLLTAQQITANFLSGPESSSAPKLSFSFSGGTLNLSWPTNSTGYLPYASGTLGTGASWSAVSGVPSISGTNYLLAVPATNQARFFRLQK